MTLLCLLREGENDDRLDWPSSTR